MYSATPEPYLINEEDYYYVLKCYTKTDFRPPECNDLLLEVPAEDFEEEIDGRGDGLIDCPAGMRVNIFDDY